MEFFSEWLIIVGLMLVGAAAPGPDFVLAIRNSLVYSRKTGLMTALGFGLGVCVHATYCIFGIAAVISQSIMLFNLIKYTGAAYLVYVGVKALTSKGYKEAQGEDLAHRTDIHWSKALAMGFMTNVLNPKATMFFFALFTQVIDPHTPLAVLVVFGATCAIVVTGWFSFVAIVLTNKHVRGKFLGFSKLIDRICGGAMIAMGLRLALAKGSAHS